MAGIQAPRMKVWTEPKQSPCSQWSKLQEQDRREQKRPVHVNRSSIARLSFSREWAGKGETSHHWGHSPARSNLSSGLPKPSAKSTCTALTTSLNASHTSAIRCEPTLGRVLYPWPGSRSPRRGAEAKQPLKCLIFFSVSPLHQRAFGTSTLSHSSLNH